MSLESRLQELEQALAARQPPKVVKVLLICAHNREQVAALDRLRARQPKQPAEPSDNRRIKLVSEFIDAGTYLREHGIELPPETENQPEEQSV